MHSNIINMFRAEIRMKRTLHEKWMQHLKDIHIGRLSNAKPRIDTTSPHRFRHLTSKSKKDQLQEGILRITLLDRFTEIERANRQLLERMTYIMHGKHNSSIDSEGKLRSLNNGFRKRQISQIIDENHALLKRLNDKKSSYNVNEWKKDFKNHTRLVSNLCEYSYKFSGKLPKISKVKSSTRTYNTEKRSKCIINN